jgi:hypothetical protein
MAVRDIRPQNYARRRFSVAAPAVALKLANACRSPAPIQRWFGSFSKSIFLPQLNAFTCSPAARSGM